MRRITRIVASLALAIGLAVWSISAHVTKVALGGPGAATLAERFPRADEMFRPVSFLRGAESDSAQAIPLPGANQLVAAACGKAEWPFLASECFPLPRQATAEPAITIARQTGENESELVRVPAASPPGAALAAACRQNLAAATARVERALAQIKGVRTNGGSDRCTTYRRHFFEIVKAREVTARCTSGAQRDRELGTIDVAVENLNGVIAQTCGG